jgi:hypothetical protein
MILTAKTQQKVLDLFLKTAIKRIIDEKKIKASCLENPTFALAPIIADPETIPI